MATEVHRLRVRVDGREYEVEVEDLQASPVIARVEGKTYQVFVEQEQTSSLPASTAPAAPLVPPEETAAAPPAAVTAAPGAITAPMPGDVVEVKVQVGDEVQAGEPVCVLDAMKMKNIIYAPQAGKVVAVNVTAGQAVDYGDVLVRLA